MADRRLSSCHTVLKSTLFNLLIKRYVFPLFRVIKQLFVSFTLLRQMKVFIFSLGLNQIQAGAHTILEISQAGSGTEFPDCRSQSVLVSFSPLGIILCYPLPNAFRLRASTYIMRHLQIWMIRPNCYAYMYGHCLCLL